FLLSIEAIKLENLARSRRSLGVIWRYLNISGPFPDGKYGFSRSELYKYTAISAMIALGLGIIGSFFWYIGYPLTVWSDYLSSNLPTYAAIIASVVIALGLLVAAAYIGTYVFAYFMVGWLYLLRGLLWI